MFDSDSIPNIGYVRLPDILKVFPVSKSSWLNGVKSGQYPKPISLGPRTVAWKVEDIRALINELNKAAS